MSIRILNNFHWSKSLISAVIKTHLRISFLAIESPRRQKLLSTSTFAVQRFCHRFSFFQKCKCIFGDLFLCVFVWWRSGENKSKRRNPWPFLCLEQLSFTNKSRQNRQRKCDFRLAVSGENKRKGDAASQTALHFNFLRKSYHSLVCSSSQKWNHFREPEYLENEQKRLYLHLRISFLAIELRQNTNVAKRNAFSFGHKSEKQTKNEVLK